LLNQLQHNIWWGQKSNFLEVPTDCPQRDERMGWTGDAQVFVRTAAFNADVSGFFAKWQRDMLDAQGKNGAVPAIVPNPCFDPESQEISDGGPAWSDATVICPWTNYLVYGDKRVLADNYDVFVRYIQHLDDISRPLALFVRIQLQRLSRFWRLAFNRHTKFFGTTREDLSAPAFFAYSCSCWEDRTSARQSRRRC
jgi:alpha-L-rhamnosidase